jgi:hypothetical protein
VCVCVCVCVCFYGWVCSILAGEVCVASVLSPVIYTPATVMVYRRCDDASEVNHAPILRACVLSTTRTPTRRALLATYLSTAYLSLERPVRRLVCLRLWLRAMAGVLSCLPKL